VRIAQYHLFEADAMKNHEKAFVLASMTFAVALLATTAW
jgi:hypothetical protein